MYAWVYNLSVHAKITLTLIIRGILNNRHFLRISSGKHVEYNLSNFFYFLIVSCIFRRHDSQEIIFSHFLTISEARTNHEFAIFFNVDSRSHLMKESSHCYLFSFPDACNKIVFQKDAGLRSDTNSPSFGHFSSLIAIVSYRLRFSFVRSK